MKEEKRKEKEKDKTKAKHKDEELEEQPADPGPPVLYFYWPTDMQAVYNSFADLPTEVQTYWEGTGLEIPTMNENFTMLLQISKFLDKKHFPHVEKRGLRSQLQPEQLEVASECFLSRKYNL